MYIYIYIYSFTQTRSFCADVLAHPWIAGDKQSTTKFDSSHIDRMKLMQAKRKLRTVVRKVVAVTRFSRALRKELA